ncbi:ankyrin repeat-containing domain protein [Ilyonectria robusta]|uniref:ankyrin repeat-containing domain protein n=1 Tax=Ilyonectria robusta TaxID=1079257 RepID=UPI001E8E01FB|nr:ankyrin repeat-containing domain protein [Ilyonectria robusta]KAH8683956.1 ankyrin repeat-containing domain protein [Ilyonectria robusta]
MPFPVPRLTNTEGDIWETHEPVIRRLYETQRKTLKEVKQIMEQDYAFPEMSLWMYETKLRDKFKLRKKLRKDDWPIVYQHFRKRDGKDTGVYLNGTEIPWKKAWKEMRRSGALSAGGSRNAPPPLPDGVDVRTPSPARPSTPHIAPLNEPASVCSMVPSPNFVARDLQAYTCQQAPRVLHEGVPVEQHLESAVFLDPGLMTYKIFLETIPWKNFTVTQLAKVNSTHQLSTNYEKLQQSQFERDSRMEFLNLRSCLHPFNILKFKLSPAASALRDEIPASTAVALEFNTYHFLARAIYELSNNLSTLPRQRPELFKILFERISRDLLFQLLASDLPTARAVWESIISAAFILDYKNEFTFFIEIGIQHPDWILSDGGFYISIAAWMNTPDIVQRLLEIEACPGKKHAPGFFPRLIEPAIIHAVYNGNPECAMLLANSIEILGVLLHFGMSLRDVAISQADLLEACLGYQSLNYFGSFYSRRLDLFELLLRHGASVTHGSPLACLINVGGHDELALELLTAGADVNAYATTRNSKLQFTPVQAAAARGNLKLVSLLVQRGADINKPPSGRFGRTALQAACDWDHSSTEDLSTRSDLIRFLIDEGAEINYSKYGVTALEIAAFRGHLEVVVMLLDHGAILNRPPINATDGTEDIYSALDFAASEGRLDVVQLLLSAGAVSRDPGKTGYDRAIALAERRSLFAVASLIRNHVQFCGGL